MEDFSLKSLAMTGMLIGAGVWAFGGLRSGSAERSPNFADIDAKPFKAVEAYRPSVNEFTQERAEPSAEVSVTNDEAQVGPDGAVKSAPAQSPLAPSGESQDFVNTRLEITRNLARGNVDDALDLAERKFEDSVKSSDLGYIGYLHDFIMQNSEDPESQLNATISAIRGTEDKNVKKFIYEKFRTYSPQATEDLDRELDAVGVNME